MKEIHTDTVLVCHCRNGGGHDPAMSERVVSELRRRRIEVAEVAEICALAAREDPTLKRFAAVERLAIVACHSRAVRWLFHAGGAPLNAEKVSFFNSRQQTADEIVEVLSKGRQGVEDAGERPLDSHAADRLESNWPPWFPVIDYDRCVNCGKCLDFCLFNVYARAAPSGTIKVVNPKGCKNLCPACSRICPRTAIIFPKLSEAPINGAEVAADDERGNVALDARGALGDDPFAALANRNRRAKRKLLSGRNDERAAAERKRHLGERQCDRGGDAAVDSLKRQHEFRDEGGTVSC